MSVRLSKQGLIKAGILTAGLMAFGQGALAQIDGVYHSDAGDECVLTISEINIPAPKFGDGYFRVESRGKAACMWDGVGMGQSTYLVGGYVTLPPVFNRVYISAKWLFGPTSPKIEMVQTNEQGEVLLTATYTRQ
ncbi:hypothetical protein [Pseudohongiella spirulinae]|uniref:Uncharacterized protein n=1 Tax=Pseudohongiella spirulinae TaxID=1249552 RepID=A0A0S2KCF0_9GAMM|nr:hypothetical protein [Pseudohongiella spirulinae]ALO45991.1 hypothetical protein PS2015_1334 [Pseudohongiella spirulinae]